MGNVVKIPCVRDRILGRTLLAFAGLLLLLLVSLVYFRPWLFADDAGQATGFACFFLILVIAAIGLDRSCYSECRQRGIITAHHIGTMQCPDHSLGECGAVAYYERPAVFVTLDHEHEFITYDTETWAETGFEIGQEVEFSWYQGLTLLALEPLVAQRFNRGNSLEEMST